MNWGDGSDAGSFWQHCDLGKPYLWRAQCDWLCLISVRALDQKFTTSYPTALTVVVADAAPDDQPIRGASHRRRRIGDYPRRNGPGRGRQSHVELCLVGDQKRPDVCHVDESVVHLHARLFGSSHRQPTKSSVTVTDAYGMSTQANSTIAVADVAPAVLAVQIGALAFAAQPTPFMVVASDPGGLNSIVTYKYDFDNSGTFATTSASSTMNHTFATAGTYTVNVMAVDMAGLASAPFSIQVQVLPVVPIASVNGLGKRELKACRIPSRLGPLQNPPALPNPITSWSINWGDGTVDTLAGSASSATHTYTDHAAYVISATVTNVDGTYAAANTLPVNHRVSAAPVLTISGPAAVQRRSLTPSTWQPRIPSTIPLPSWTDQLGGWLHRDLLSAPQHCDP